MSDGRQAALAQVMERRDAGRSRSAPIRALLAAGGLLLLVAAVPLAVVLPELGIPALLIALRLLAVEFDWAARGYAWVVWRWTQLKAWFRRQPGPTRALIAIALLAVAVLLLWLLVREFE